MPTFDQTPKNRSPMRYVVTGEQTEGPPTGIRRIDDTREIEQHAVLRDEAEAAMWPDGPAAQRVAERLRQTQELDRLRAAHIAGCTSCNVPTVCDHCGRTPSAEEVPEYCLDYWTLRADPGRRT